MTDAASKGLSIAVLVKAIPSVNDIGVDPATRTPTIPTETVMNTYDAYGVSAAIGLKEASGGTVTAVAIDRPGVREIVTRAMATGADAGLILEGVDTTSTDSLATARALAGVLAERGFDVVIAGQSSEDGESGQVGPQVAECLGWPHVSLVTHVDHEGDELVIHRDAEGQKETVAVSTPAVLVVLSGRDGEQRFPTLRGMMAAKKKPLDVIQVNPEKGARLRWTDPIAPERKAAGIMVVDKPAAEAAAELVAWLKAEKLR